MGDVVDIKSSTGHVWGRVVEENGQKTYKPYPGRLTPQEIIDELTYSSYRVQRDDGMTPEQCKSIGFANVMAMEKRWKAENSK